MHALDWLIVIAYLGWVVQDGWKRSRQSQDMDGYLLGNRALPWWAVGLSIMATQLSAITVIGTTGQGFADGMRFVQFYFGLPLAMIVLSLTVVPFFHRARVYTAYEFLERRFDLKTRLLTSLLFLFSRGMSCGVIISAPAVLVSVMLGFSTTATVLLIGLPTAIYTVLGGVQTVTWADVKQMAVIVLGFAATIVVLILALPDSVSLNDALHLAGSVGRTRSLDFRFDLEETYTFWSGLLGGTFLMLSYFGCDQSQVQRYLTAKSVDEARRSLLMSAITKIPLQAVVLLVGVLMYTFYVFHPRPMLFDTRAIGDVLRSENAAVYQDLDRDFTEALAARRDAALAGDRESFVTSDRRMEAIRGEAKLVVEGVSGATYKDVNHVFPTLIMNALPVGLVGLLIAAIFAAAMSSIAAELNALGTVTVIDFYRRLWRPNGSEQHMVLMARVATAFWGLFACWVATKAASLGSLIEVVNRFGSFFYGSILGVFVLALATRRATGTGAFVGLIAGMSAVYAVATLWPKVSFLWHNPVGLVTVVIVGLAVSSLDGRASPLPSWTGAGSEDSQEHT